MIYLVTKQQELFDSDDYQIITVEESLNLMKDWRVIQFDTETDGRDPHVNHLLCMQFGNEKADTQIVVDVKSTDVKLYKNILESKLIIGQNLKFDIEFLYNYGIIPRNVYDTMIVEQLLYLGYGRLVTYNLKDIAKRRLNIDIDKSVRGQIIWRGLDAAVIKYAAGDVTYLEAIMHSQVQDYRAKNMAKAAYLECRFVPVIAYLEWCGVHLDEEKWKEKMKHDKERLDSSKETLDDYASTLPQLQKFFFIDRQGSLFEGFDLTPKCSINWASSKQAAEVAKLLGFNTTVRDKKTGADKDSVLEKFLKTQKGINDKFLKLYFDYQEAFKTVTSFGQGHLNAINPFTHRIHSVFRQFGAASGRLSCGSNQPNTDLAKVKHLPPSQCTYPNLQQLPANEETRSAFTAEKGNMFVSCDYSAEESRLAADIYNDAEFKKEFTERTGDTHSMFAWAVFKNECKQCGCQSAADVRKKAPQWRKKVKAVELSYADSLR